MLLILIISAVSLSSGEKVGVGVFVSVETGVLVGFGVCEGMVVGIIVVTVGGFTIGDEVLSPTTVGERVEVEGTERSL